MKYNITDESITLFENNKTRIINMDEIIIPHEQEILKWLLVEKLDYETICKKVDAIIKNTTPTLIEEKEIQKSLDLNDTTIEEIINFTNGQLEIVSNQVLWRKEKIENKKLVDFILHYYTNKIDFSFVEIFLEKLYLNPDPVARNDIFDFIVNRCGILKDGDFLAYKRIKSNYKDCHTGTMDNSIGMVVKMDRSKCDNNPRQTCSRGLHVCTKGYLSSFGGDKVVLCKVNPRDVVAIPSDYHAMKMRTCEYKVIGEIKDQKEFNDIIEDLYKNPNDPSVYEKLKLNITAETSKGLIKTINNTIDLNVGDIIETLNTIFENDSKVMSSFKAGKKLIESTILENEDLTKALENEYLNRALKLRPTNKKLQFAISEWNEKKEEAEEAARLEAIRLEEDAKAIEEENRLKEEEAIKLAAMEKSMSLQDYSEDQAMRNNPVLPNTQTNSNLAKDPSTLVEAFKTDSKVAKALEKFIGSTEDIFDSMVERIKKLRPGSKKLRDIIGE